MGKSLRADIIIGGKADGSFFELGNDLQALGAQINGMSQKLIEFGVDSAKTYASYEDAMLDAQVALRTQYKSTDELSKAMEQLDAAAQAWASDSRFTTMDVAGAISEAAHAGWDLERIFSGVPAAMKVSLAGGMSLSEGLEYLVDISNAAGLEFSELAGFVDTWTFAANKSSTKVPEMGAAMQKMGATLQFVKGDMAALTTMLAVLANNGAKGTEAGTLLRNSMIRLIAPTKTAAETMDGLAVSAEDLEEIYSGTAHLEEVSAMLEEAGFSAYDANGELKGFLDVFQDLEKATSGMTEQDRNKVLSTIFPTRTITGALALLDAAKEGWGGLYDSIKTGSEGYAEYAAQTMESGLGGSMRHLESVIDAFKTKTGDALSEEVSWGADKLSGMIENINGMDDGKFNAIVSGATALAGAGPALLAAGGAIKLLGALAGTGPLGQIALIGTGLAMGASGLEAWSKASHESNFGELSVDAEMLGGYLDTLGTSFQESQEKIEQHNAAIDKAVEGYTTASSQLKKGLIGSMLTKENLTGEMKANLNGLGEQMRKELLAGINGNFAANEDALLNMEELLGAEDLDSGFFDELMALLNTGFGDAISTAEQLSAQLREALASAFEDDALGSDEIGKIQDIMDQMNELMAKQAAEQNYVDQQALLRKAQTMGLDGLEESYAEATELRDKYWETQEQNLDRAKFNIDEAFKKNYGQTIDGVTYDDAWYARMNDQWERSKAAAKNQHYADYDGFLMDVFDVTMDGSDYAGAFKKLEGLTGRYLSGAQLTNADLIDFINGTDANQRSGIHSVIGGLVDQLGGVDAMLDRAEQFREEGRADMADRLLGFATMADMMHQMSFGDVLMGDLGQEYKTLFEGEHPELTVTPQIDQGSIQEQLGEPTMPVIAEVNQDELNQLDGLDGKTVDIQTRADTTGSQAVQASVDALTGKDVNIVTLADTSGAEEAQAAVDSVHGKSVTISIHTVYSSSGGGGGGGGGSSKSGGAMKNASDIYSGYYAQGGRADEASVFGEAGPEWAIPEQHNQRTADLLRRAAQASGFTWPELLSMNGGNSKPGTTLVYSPTIMANDASGVEQKLLEDKDRLEKWLKEKQLHDEVEVYA